jgi:signal transduction histidine kinase
MSPKAARPTPPTSGGRQFSELARALALMRERLEGKQYVERYVQNLAHEMKSPLSAIIGAAEILEGHAPPTMIAGVLRSASASRRDACRGSSNGC